MPKVARTISPISAIEACAIVAMPFASAANDYRWDEAARADLKDYNLDDLSI